MIGPTTYRLAWRRKMTKRYRALAFFAVLALATLAVFPVGVSTSRSANVVTGHSTFYNGDDFDPCLASIVGIMRMRVMWFNDMVLIERYNGDGAYIYATQEGAGNPLEKETLVSSGMFYDFVDPNGVEWHVQEAYWDETVNWAVEGGVNPNTIIEDAETNGPADYRNQADDITTNLTAETHRYYTWIVAVGRAQRDNFAGADPHTFYNFVTVVNTCKFKAQNATVVDHTADELLNNLYGHYNSDGPHEHEGYVVDLYVGGVPKILPAGLATPNYVNSNLGYGIDVGDASPPQEDSP